jgi:hypothetical protein
MQGDRSPVLSDEGTIMDQALRPGGHVCRTMYTECFQLPTEEKDALPTRFFYTLENCRGSAVETCGSSSVVECVRKNVP